MEVPVCTPLHCSSPLFPWCFGDRLTTRVDFAFAPCLYLCLCCFGFGFVFVFGFVFGFGFGLFLVFVLFLFSVFYHSVFYIFFISADSANQSARTTPTTDCPELLLFKNKWLDDHRPIDLTRRHISTCICDICHAMRCELQPGGGPSPAAPYLGQPLR